MNTKQKIISWFFIGFVALALLSPIWVFKDLLFPFITSKAFLFRIFIELALPFYVYLVVANNKLRPSWRNPLFGAMLLFVFFYFISAIFGVNANRSIWGNFERMGGVYYLAHLVLLAFYVALMGQMAGKYLKFILYWALGVALFITFNGISGWLGGPTVVADPSLPARVSSTLGNPIFLGSFLILPMFFCLFFALQTDNWGKKIMFWVFALLQFIGIFLSATRGALVGLAGGLIVAAGVYLFLNQKQKVRRYGVPIWAVGTMLIVALFVFHQKLPQNRITRIFNLEDANTQARLIQWKIALTGFKDRPLLGVGPENYYFIANKYYNPELINFDASWFDKPHNYILEVLVTGGVFSFAAYAGMLILVLWGLYKGFKSEFLSLTQACLLAAGFLAYLLQNLFVFDTIPASLMFFVFVGFTAYLWTETQSAPQSKPAAKKLLPHDSMWAEVAAVIVGIGSLYIVYLTNVQPMQAAKDVNYGYAYINVENGQTKANDYFQSAVQNGFNFDLQDTSQRYSELASSLAQSSQLDPQTTAKIIDQITNFQKQVAEQIGNDPISWQRLAGDYYFQAVASQSALGPYSEYAIKKAIDLAPHRYEPDLFLAQVYLAENHPDKALEQLTEMEKFIPLTNYTATSHWLEAYIDHVAGRDADGVKIVNDLLDKKFNPSTYRDVSWVIGYYAVQKDLQRALVLAQLSSQLFPNDADAFFITAQLYAKTGSVETAKQMAQKLIDSDAPNKQAAQDFLKNLK